MDSFFRFLGQLLIVLVIAISLIVFTNLLKAVLQTQQIYDDVILESVEYPRVITNPTMAIIYFKDGQDVHRRYIVDVGTYSLRYNQKVDVYWAFGGYHVVPEVN